MHRLADQEQLHVDPEAVQDRVEGLARVEAVEERLVHPRPPRRAHDADRQHGEDHDGDHGGDQRLPDPLPPAYLAALELAVAGRPGALTVTHCRTGTSTSSGEPLLLELVEGAVRVSAASASLTQRHQRVALLEEHPELLLLAGLRLELADDHAVLDLAGGDVERGRQVRDDAVDLVVEQRLLGGVGVLEDGRLVGRLDRRRGSRSATWCRSGRRACTTARSAMLVALAMSSPLERDQGLGGGVVAVGEVDDLGPLRRDRDLVDVEVEVLVARLVRRVERHLDPRHLVLGEAELLGHGVGDGRLVALAVGRVVVDEPRLVGRRVGADGQRARRAQRQLVGGAGVDGSGSVASASSEEVGAVGPRSGSSVALTLVVLRRAGNRDQDQGQDGEAGTKAHERDRRARGRQSSMSRPGLKPGVTCAARARRSSRSACQVWPESVRRST